MMKLLLDSILYAGVHTVIEVFNWYLGIRAVELLTFNKLAVVFLYTIVAKASIGQLLLLAYHLR